MQDSSVFPSVLLHRRMQTVTRTERLSVVPMKQTGSVTTGSSVRVQVQAQSSTATPNSVSVVWQLTVS